MLIRHKALTMSILLILNQPSQAAFNLIDEPEPEVMPRADWGYRSGYGGRYGEMPPEPERPYRQVAYNPPVQAVYSAYHEQQTEPDTALPQSISATGVVEIGMPDMNIQVIKKSGKRKPLPEALRAILPKGWHAKKKADVDRALPISWEGGWDWVTTLNDVAREYRLSIVVDWNAQTVTVLKQERPEPALQETALNGQHDLMTVTEDKWNQIKPGAIKDIGDVKPADKALPLSPIGPIAEPDKAIAATAPVQPIAAYIPSLHLVNGQKMSESLDTWVKAIGWNLIWDAKVDYPVSVNTTFVGTPEEVITKFGDAIVHSHLPLHIDVYKQNKTVRVSN